MRRMKRALAVLACLAAAALVFLLPHGDPARLAAANAHQLLALAPSEGERPLGEQILDGPAVIERGEGRIKLSLFGCIFATQPASEDLTVHDLARRSVVRGLRELADKRGLALEVEGERNAAESSAERGAGLIVMLDGERLSLQYSHRAATTLTVHQDGWRAPQRSSLYPPVLAILLAVLFRKPLLALFAGVWCAATLLRMGSGSSLLGALAGGLPDVATDMLWPQLVDSEKQLIIGFVFAMLSMVGVMTVSGGIRGLVDALAKFARGVRSTQLATFGMGLAVFFDDYANCILVGTTMRPLSDRFRISREKLSYIVDSTAAPVAGISIFSTWIAYEVSTFAPQLPAAGMSPSEGYAVFVESLPYRFYCIFTLVMVALVVLLGRDFGPMLAAERRARSTGQLVREGGKPMVGDAATQLEPAPGVTPRALNALAPVLTFVIVTLAEITRVGLRNTGLEFSALFSDFKAVTAVLSDGESSRAILVGSSSGLALAILLALLSGAGRQIPRAIAVTLRNTGIAVGILYFAWMIGAACESLGTASFLSDLVGPHLAPQALPTVLFLLSAGIAFATGTSWGTMSILLPLVVGLAFSMGELVPLGGHGLLILSIAAVLEGSIFGDHCSPISDTTILSSTACAADHLDHTRTQMAYAVTTMAVAIVCGYFPCAFMGWSPWIALPTGCAALLMLLLVFGRKTDPVPA
jgi:Na+/H+ antiporter NhaC